MKIAFLEMKNFSLTLKCIQIHKIFAFSNCKTPNKVNYYLENMLLLLENEIRAYQNSILALINIPKCSKQSPLFCPRKYHQTFAIKDIPLPSLPSPPLINLPMKFQSLPNSLFKGHYSVFSYSFDQEETRPQ